MRLQIVWTTAALIMVALSGCADDASENTQEVEEGFEDYDLEVTDDTGIIKGFVLDSAINPIEGIKVSILNTDLNVTTNVNGAYGFSGLQAGAYKVVAEHFKYETLQKDAVVVAGEKNPDNLNFVLERNPTTKPDTSVISKKGFLACSFTTPSVSVAACGVGPVGALTGNEFINYVTYDQTPDFIQSEMIWDATNLAGESMSLSWTDPADGAQLRINASSGPSPLLVTVDRPHWEAMNLTGKELWLRVFSTAMEGSDHVDEDTWNGPYRSNNVYETWNGTAPDAVKDAIEQNVFGVRTLTPFGEDCVKYPVLFDACYGFGGVGATIQQDYEIFNTAFFNFLPDEGWMFANDGEHPLPEE